MKTTDFIKESIGEDADNMHRDHEVQMARSDCYHAAKYAIELHKMLQGVSETQGMDGWVSEKITLANDYLRTVWEYLSHEQQSDDQAELPMFTFEAAEREFNQSLNEGYYDLNDDGMQPIDLSANPSFKQIVNRYTQLVYQGHAGETSPEEDEEYDAIEQYVAKRFGAKGSAHLQKAGETSYWGRDDGRGTGGSKNSNLGWPSMPVDDFRKTTKGKMHGQDASSKKKIIAKRLGSHPEPTLPESKKPVNEMTAGGTGAGSIGGGVVGALGGKTKSTGKPKKVGNILRRVNPQIGKGIY